jgi:glycosyltransferase involved in cell wall biosynthesis
VEKFLFVGRWHKVKNIPNLLKLVALFSEQKKISLTMVGSDLDEKNQELVNLVDTMGLTGITELVGYTRDVTSFYSTHDCLIISSKTESYPNVAVEALVNGCRVLASDVGDTKLIVGEAGVIIDYDDNIMRNSLTTSVFQKLESITEEQINTQANILLERHAAKTFLRTIELQKKVNIDVE